jgi:trk system potassium uptake protein
MRAVIVGGGLAGTALGATLAKSGHVVTIVDRDATVAARSFAEHGVATIVGDGASPDVLRAADVPRADVVAAMLRRDADNLAVVVATHAMSEARVVVRVRDIAYRPLYEQLGVDHVFGEVETLAESLGLALEHPRIGHSLVLGSGGSVAFEIMLGPNAPVIGRTVRDVATDAGFPKSAVVATVAAPGAEAEPARGDTVLPAGGEILVIARRREIASALEFFLGLAAPVRASRTG